MASDLMLALAAVIGLFLMWLGWVIFGVADSGSGRDAGQVVKSFGLLILTISMMLGGIVRVDMEKWVRVSMIIGAVLLVTWEGFWAIY
jgi:hypothetical protein